MLGAVFTSNLLFVGVVQGMIRLEIRNAQGSAGTVEFVGAALLILSLAEIWQHIVIGPPGVAELPPEIEILALAADIDQAVDRG